MIATNSPKRFLATVNSPDPAAMRRLTSYGFDLFRHSARAIARTNVVLSRVTGAATLEAYETTDQQNECRELTIEGLLSLESIAQLVEDGYSVLVREAVPERSPVQTGGIDFQTWLKALEEN